MLSAFVNNIILITSKQVNPIFKFFLFFYKIIIRYIYFGMNKDLVNQKNSILNGQLTNSILSIIGIVIGIVIIIDQKEKANGKEGFLENKTSQDLALLSRIIFLFVVIYALELNYKSYNLSKATNQDTSSLKLQISSSYLSIIVASIGLYVVITNYSNSNLQPAEVENDFL